jgi:hypothetical protein
MVSRCMCEVAKSGVSRMHRRPWFTFGARKSYDFVNPTVRSATLIFGLAGSACSVCSVFSSYITIDVAAESNDTTPYQIIEFEKVPSILKRKRVACANLHTSPPPFLVGSS